MSRAIRVAILILAVVLALALFNAALLHAAVVGISMAVSR